MYKFKCWMPSDGETEETSMLIESLEDDVGTAAVQFVKTVEEDTSYYYVGLENQFQLVSVRRVSDNELFMVSVTGDPKPTYNNNPYVEWIMG